MIKNLLVPIDGSALSHTAIKDAALMAKKLGATATGFYVAPSYHNEVYTDYVNPEWSIHSGTQPPPRGTRNTICASSKKTADAQSRIPVLVHR